VPSFQIPEIRLPEFPKKAQCPPPADKLLFTLVEKRRQNRNFADFSNTFVSAVMYKILN
jgi:hypothetical protein